MTKGGIVRMSFDGLGISFTTNVEVTCAIKGSVQRCFARVLQICPRPSLQVIGLWIRVSIKNFHPTFRFFMGVTRMFEGEDVNHPRLNKLRFYPIGVGRFISRIQRFTYVVLCSVCVFIYTGILIFDGLVSDITCRNRQNPRLVEGVHRRSRFRLRRFLFLSFLFFLRKGHVLRLDPLSRMARACMRRSRGNRGV